MSRPTPCCISASTSAPAPTEAQEFGFSTILQFFDRVIDATRRAPTKAGRDDALARRLRLLAGTAARRRLVRRLSALPRGLPGRQRLSRASRRAAEGHPGEDAARRSRSAKELPGERASAATPIAGLNDWNIRWVGPDGYKGMVARQLQEFKRRRRSARRPRTQQESTEMVAIFKRAAHRGRDQGEGAELGADLVGIADGDGARAPIRPIPPIRAVRPTSPSSTATASSCSPSASTAASRASAAWDDRHKYYNDELALIAAGGNLARAGLLARGSSATRRSSCRRRTSIRGATTTIPTRI